MAWEQQGVLETLDGTDDLGSPFVVFVDTDTRWNDGYVVDREFIYVFLLPAVGAAKK